MTTAELKRPDWDKEWISDEKIPVDGHLGAHSDLRGADRDD